MSADINDPYVREICKIGQGADCCKYLLLGGEGFSCAKLDAESKLMIEVRAHRMGAKGDNCEGKAL